MADKTPGTPLDYHPYRRAARDPGPPSDGQAFSGMIVSGGLTVGALVVQKYHLLLGDGWTIRPPWVLGAVVALAVTGAAFYRTRNWPSFGVGLWVGLGVFGLLKVLELFIS